MMGGCRRACRLRGRCTGWSSWPPTPRGTSFVEGEKCVDALRDAWPEPTPETAFVPTTWPAGSGQWNYADWSPLAGRRVAILADADEGGRKAAQGIAHKLHALGCEVRLALPEGDTGADVADWLAVSREHAETRIGELLQPFEPDPGYQLPPDSDPEPRA